MSTCYVQTENKRKTKYVRKWKGKLGGFPFFCCCVAFNMLCEWGAKDDMINRWYTIFISRGVPTFGDRMYHMYHMYRKREITCITYGVWQVMRAHVYLNNSISMAYILHWNGCIEWPNCWATPTPDIWFDYFGISCTSVLARIHASNLISETLWTHNA